MHSITNFYHREESGQDEEEEFDRQVQRVEVAANKVKACRRGSVLKKAREPELLIEVGNLRDFLEKVIQGEKSIVSRVFSANRCQRFGRLHLLIDTVDLEVYSGDVRWAHLQNQIGTVESVLRELNTFCWWGRPDDAEQDALQAKSLATIIHPKVSKGFRNRGVEDDDNSESENDGALFPCRFDFDELEQACFFASLPEEGPLMTDCSQQDDKATHDDATLPQCDHQDDNIEPCDEYLMLGSDQQDDTAGESQNLPINKIAHDALLSELNETICSPTARMNNPNFGGERELDTNSDEKWLSPNSVFEGWVWKRSKHLKMWKRRWLVLGPDELTSFKRNKTKATTKIERGTVYDVYIADYELQLKRTFCILGYGKRKFYIACDTKEERENWMQQIVQVLGSARKLTK